MITWKKTNLVFLSLMMVASIINFTSITKVNAASKLINNKDFIVINSGGEELNDGTEEKVSDNITPQRIKKAIFDGNTSTYWQSVSSENGVSYGNEISSLIIDLGKEYQITEIIYKARANGSSYNATGNADGKLFVDLATTYSTAWDSEQDISLNAPVQWEEGTTSITFEATTARYVRLSADSSYHWKEEEKDKIFCVADLEIYGTNADGSEVEDVARNVAARLSASQVKAVYTSDGSNAKPNETDRPLTQIFDGNKANGEYAHFSSDTSRVSSYLQFDLGDVYNLSEVKMWRYADGARKYTNTTILIAEEENFDTYEVIYNSDTNNVHGLDLEATDEDYIEDSSGKTFPINNVNARYVRMYMYGNTAGNQNHVIEVEVYGVNKKVVALDKTTLNNLMQEIESLTAETYTIKSWSNLMTAVNEANEVITNATSQEQLNEAYEDLLEMKNLLVDRSPLKAILDTASSKLSQTDKYTTESLNALRRVYNTGLEAYNNDFSDYVQADVYYHVNRIQEKMDALEEMVIVLDKRALIQLIMQVEGLKQNDYSIKSWSNLKVALDSGRRVRDHATTQVEIDDAKNELQAKEDALVNRTTLKEALNAAERKLAETDKYTIETYNALKKAYDDGKLIYENETVNYSQSDVKHHVDTIYNAMDNLKLKEVIVDVLNKKPLEDKIAEASALDADVYYEPSYNDLSNAIADAMNALNTVKTNDDVAREVAKLQAVMDALIKRPERVTGLNAYALNYKTIQLEWNAVEDATYYQIYRLNTQTNKWIKFKTADTNSYRINGVKTGVKYSYRVIANKVLANGKVVAGKSSSTNSATALLEGEPILTMKANGKTKFDLSWTRVEGATRYLVYRKSSSEGWKKILTLGGDVTTYTTSSMVPNTYTFMIKAARYDSSERTQTNGSNACEGITVFDAPQVKVAKASATSAKVSWEAVEGVTYYEVYRAVDNGVYEKVKTTTALNYTSKSLKKGKTYQFKVKAYRTYNYGKVYTDFSKVGSYTVK